MSIVSHIADSYLADRRPTMAALYPPPHIEGILERRTTDDIDPHLTMLYLGELTSGEAGRFFEIVSNLDFDAPSELGVDGHGVFTNDDADVRVVLWNAFGLDRFRVQLLDAATSADLLRASGHGFIPHTTLQYCDDPLDSFEVPRLGDLRWPLDRLWIMHGDDTVGSVRL